MDPRPTERSIGRSATSHLIHPSERDGDAFAMQRLLSCFTNSYGAAGVRTAVERIKETGIDHLEWRCVGMISGVL